MRWGVGGWHGRGDLRMGGGGGGGVLIGQYEASESNFDTARLDGFYDFPLINHGSTTIKPAFTAISPDAI